MHVLVVMGTRPEAIKLWPVINALRGAGFETIVCDTGQHRDLLAQALPMLELTPEVRLDLMSPGSSLDVLASRMTTGVSAAIDDFVPDWVIVQGDTTTALAAARASRTRGVRLAHVEAGLRSFDPMAPWPEELNRCEITRLADLHFAPTPRAASNLRAAGVAPASIVVTGNTAIDALQAMTAKLDSSPALRDAALDELGAIPETKRIIVVTAHRRENILVGLVGLADGLVELAARGDVEILLPLHPNPATGSFASMLEGVQGITLRPPLSYPACLTLMQRAALLITDSGGLQEEAPSLGLPMLVTRKSTERPEAIECGAGRLVQMDLVARAAFDLLDDPLAYDAMAQIRHPFGDGQAASRIVDRLKHAVVDDQSEDNYVWPSFS